MTKLIVALSNFANKPINSKDCEFLRTGPTLDLYLYVKSNRQCTVEGLCLTEVDCTFAVSVSVSVTESVVR